MWRTKKLKKKVEVSPSILMIAEKPSDDPLPITYICPLKLLSSASHFRILHKQL